MVTKKMCSTKSNKNIINCVVVHRSILSFSAKWLLIFQVVLIVFSLNIPVVIASENDNLLEFYNFDNVTSEESLDETNLVSGVINPDEDEHFFDIEKVELDEFERVPEFHGFIKFGWPIKGHNEDAADETTNVFDQTELTLWFGMDILRNLSFTTEMEFEDGFEEFTFELFVFDLNVFDELLTFRLGKFVYPFGIERLVEDAPHNKLISRPTPAKHIMPGTYSDNGIEFFGTVPLFPSIQLKYELALTAGLSGPGGKGEQDFSENNDSKTVGGRLGFVLFKGLEIGSSYSNGKYDDSDKLRLDFFGIDLSFKKGGFEFRGEYIRGNVEGDNIKTDSYNRDGYYAQMSYQYMPELNYFRFLEGVTRFDSVDPNDIVTNESDTNRASFGFNYSPKEHIEFKLEYIVENEAKESIEKNFVFQTVLTW